MTFFVRLILRRAGWVVTLGAAFTCVGALYSVELYKNLRTDIEELLPTTARSVIDLNEVTSRLESTENLAIVVLSDRVEASRRFVVDLAARLERLPKNVIASVEYKIDRELAFFEKRRSLYMDYEDLATIRDFIRDRINFEKELYNPLNIFRTTELPEPILDFLALQKKYSSKVSSYTRFPDGFYATTDQKIRVILVNLPGKLSGIDGAKALRAAVDREIEALKPASYSPELTLKFTGGVQNLIEEHASLMADLELSTIVVLIIVTLSLYMFYKTARGTIVLMISLIWGTLWTFGVSYFAVGYLNANSAFLGAIVLGNGINFGLILLARYLEERRRLVENTRAVYIAMKRTFPATVVAALAAGLAYGSLVLTGFRGFRQFGIIGFIGMVLCWISAYTILPALLVLLERWWPIGKKLRLRPHRMPFSNALASLIQRWPRWIWGLSLVLTLLAFMSFIRYDSGIIQTDLSKLRDKTSMESGSAFNSKFVDQVFERYLSPVVILPKSREDAYLIAQRLKQKKEESGEKSFISAVYSIDDFLPRQQERKIHLLRDIQKILPERMIRRLPTDQQKLVAELLAPENFRLVTEKDLPPLILTKFTERDGTLGKLVLVEPPLGTELWNGENLVNFVKDLRDAADSVKSGTAVAGALPVTSDMFQAIRRDGPRATIFALASVVLLAIFLFRDIKTVGVVLMALFLGVLWLVGVILAFDIKINFLNFIALPITFGIGMDYGINMFQRYRLEGPGQILKTIRQTGGAVALASWTTTVGYGSLLIAGNQAFVSFGILAVVGEITCLFAAVVSLPAYLITLTTRQSRHSEALSEPGVQANS